MPKTKKKDVPKQTAMTNTIEHLVIGGGGPAGFTMLGALRELAKQGYWNKASLKSAYGCSVGALLSCLVILADDWDGLISYVVGRPWEKLAPSGADVLTSILSRNGALGEDFFREALSPYLRVLGLPDDITFQQWNEKIGVRVHFLSQDLNKPGAESEIISAESFPDLPVYRGIAMSAAFPLVAAPVFVGGGCFIDGGIKGNFPLDICLSKEQCEPESVLALRSASWCAGETPPLTPDSSILDLGARIVLRLSEAAFDEDLDRGHQETVQCGTLDLRMGSTWMATLESADKRLSLVREGEIQAHLFRAYRAQLPRGSGKGGDGEGSHTPNS